MEPNFAVARNRGASFATSAGGLAVYPLWRGKVPDAIREIESLRDQLTRKLAVAAVLPEQELDLNEMDELEAAGLLVIEVPNELKAKEGADVAAFVEEQIDGADAVAAVVAEPVAAGAAAVADSEEVDAQLSTDDEHALLQQINEAEADEGGA